MADRKLMRTIERLIDTNSQSPFFKNFIGGPNVRAFEKAFARFVGTRYAVSMANGTLGLYAAYSVLHSASLYWLCPPYTFVSTISEIVRANDYVRFIDVRLDNFSIDPFVIRENIRVQSANGLRGIVAMHPLGSPADMDQIMHIAAEYELMVVEDACQFLHPHYELRGTIAVFSLQQTKSLSTGEGSMVVTNDKELYDKLCYFRNVGTKYAPFKEKYADIMATNLRLTEIQSAIGLYALRGYDKVVKHQLMLGKILKEAMEKTDWLIPQDPWTENGYIFAGRIRGCADGVTSKWQCYTPNVPHTRAIETRARFLKKVKRWNKGVPGKVIGPGYSELVYELPAFRSYARPCPVAEMWRDHAVWMDLRGYSQEEVKTISRVVEKFRP